MTGGLLVERLAWIDGLVASAVERGVAPGVIAMVARGDTVHVATAGVRDVANDLPMLRDTIVRVASMTKPLIAAAAMLLVEEARIALDDPVDRWLPELADRRVLRSIDGAIDDTVPAARAITLRDLLTFRAGIGIIMAQPGTWPIQVEMERLGVAPGPHATSLDPDTWMARIGALPLAHQPGERWMYHVAIDILAVLISRIVGRPIGAFLAEHIFGPLGMVDTAYHVPAAQLDRLAICYAQDDQGLGAWDGIDGEYSRPPPFESELVSTADDYRAFATMLLRGGGAPDGRILSRASVSMMTNDQLTPEQKALSPFPGLWDGRGWGFSGLVVTERTEPGAGPGRYGWSGGLGTHFMIDPAEGLFATLLTQRMMRGPDDDRLARDLFTLAYAAIDD